MRYLLITYVKKPDGKIDESAQVSKKVKPRDWQTTNVILDFKDLKVLKCSMDGTMVDKDWDRIVNYYFKYYPSIIERLFNENGYQVVKPDSENESAAADTSS